MIITMYLLGCMHITFNPVAVVDIDTEYSNENISNIMKALDKVDSEADKAKNVLEQHDDTLNRLEEKIQ